MLSSRRFSTSSRNSSNSESEGSVEPVSRISDRRNTSIDSDLRSFKHADSMISVQSNIPDHAPFGLN